MPTAKLPKRLARIEARVARIEKALEKDEEDEGPFDVLDDVKLAKMVDDFLTGGRDGS